MGIKDLERIGLTVSKKEIIKEELQDDPEICIYYENCKLLFGKPTKAECERFQR